MNFPRLMRDWNNPHWAPRFFGGRRLSRVLKKKFKAYGFYWINPGYFPTRWIYGPNDPAWRGLNYRYTCNERWGR